MILASITISDWDQYWSTFSTRGKELREKHGSNGVRVFRDTEDPNRVYGLFDWDRERFEEFMNDPEAPEVMRAAGLQGPPDPTFLEPAGELEH